jgi:hypothetical protein
MNPTFAFLTQVTIDSTNKWIEVDIGAGDVPISITEQDYDDVIAVAAALQAALIAGAHASFTVAVGATGTVTIARTGNFTISWKTGVHGSDNADDHIGDVLGFSDAADDNGGNATFDSDNQHMYGWYAEDPHNKLFFDSKDRKLRVGPATFIAVSGRATRTTLATQVRRRIDVMGVTPEKFYSAEADTNEDFETWWLDTSSAKPFIYYSNTTLWTNQGKFCLIVKQNEDLLEQVPRLTPAAEYYSFSMNVVEQS